MTTVLDRVYVEPYVRADGVHVAGHWRGHGPEARDRRARALDSASPDFATGLDRGPWKEWWESLDAKAQGELQEYTGDSRSLNRALRKHAGNLDSIRAVNPIWGAMAAQADVIDHALEKAPKLPEDTILYRGMRDAFMGEAQPGDEITDRAFTSTANLDLAAGFAGLNPDWQLEHFLGPVVEPTVITLRVPAGTRVGHVDLPDAVEGNLEEWLLPRNSTIRIEAVRHEDVGSFEYWTETNPSPEVVGIWPYVQRYGLDEMIAEELVSHGVWEGNAGDPELWPEFVGVPKVGKWSMDLERHIREEVERRWTEERDEMAAQKATLIEATLLPGGEGRATEPGPIPKLELGTYVYIPGAPEIEDDSVYGEVVQVDGYRVLLRDMYGDESWHGIYEVLEAQKSVKGRVWVDPHVRHGADVAGYWREIGEAGAWIGDFPDGTWYGWDAPVVYMPNKPDVTLLNGREQPFWKALYDPDRDEMLFWFVGRNGQPHHDAMVLAAIKEDRPFGEQLNKREFLTGYGPNWGPEHWESHPNYREDSWLWRRARLVAESESEGSNMSASEREDIAKEHFDELVSNIRQQLRSRRRDMADAVAFAHGAKTAVWVDPHLREGHPVAGHFRDVVTRPRLRRDTYPKLVRDLDAQGFLDPDNELWYYAAKPMESNGEVLWKAIYDKSTGQSWIWTVHSKGVGSTLFGGPHHGQTATLFGLVPPRAALPSGVVPFDFHPPKNLVYATAYGTRFNNISLRDGSWDRERRELEINLKLDDDNMPEGLAAALRRNARKLRQEGEAAGFVKGVPDQPRWPRGTPLGGRWKARAFALMSLDFDPEEQNPERGTAAWFYQQMPYGDGKPDYRMRYAEMVPTEVIADFMEYDRMFADSTNDPQYLSALRRHIGDHGMGFPIFLDYNVETGNAHVSEGHHRIEVARYLGLPAVPVLVYPSRREGRRSKPLPYSGDPRKLPEFVKPSEFGLPMFVSEKGIKRIWVDAYQRADGTLVEGYWRDLSMEAMRDPLTELTTYAPSLPPEPGLWEGSRDVYAPYPPRWYELSDKLQDDSASEEEKQELYAITDERRAKDDEWQASMSRALSLGWLTWEEADARGFRGSGHDRPREDAGYGERGWQEFPPIELYHITTAKDAVKEGGLKSRAELSQESGGTGLGAGDEFTVSFTADPAIASEILRSIREANDVLNDRITPEQLVENAKTGADAREPYWDDDIEERARLLDATRDVRRSQEFTAIHKTLEEWREEFPGAEPASPPLVGGDGKERYNRISRPNTPEEVLRAKWRLYTYLASVRERVGGPMNPLFMSTNIVALKNTPRDQIGLLRFRPRKNAHGYYLAGLNEWRTYTGDAVELIPEEEAPAVPSLPDWWNEPSENPYRKDFTKGEEIMDWLERHDLKPGPDGRYTFYHGSPASNDFEFLRGHTQLETDPEAAAFFAARDRDLDPKDPAQVTVHAVRVFPWEIRGGIWASLRDDYPLPGPGEKSVKRRTWVDPYLRADGVNVIGHWRSREPSIPAGWSFSEPFKFGDGSMITLRDPEEPLYEPPRGFHHDPERDHAVGQVGFTSNVLRWERPKKADGSFDYEQPLVLTRHSDPYGEDPWIEIGLVLVKEDRRRQGLGLKLIEQLVHLYPPSEYQYRAETVGSAGGSLMRAAIDSGILPSGRFEDTGWTHSGYEIQRFASEKRVWVKPYERADGTHVAGYWRGGVEAVEDALELADARQLWDLLTYPDVMSDFYDPDTFRIVEELGQVFREKEPIHEDEENTEMGHCFQNATNCMLAFHLDRYRDMTYVEGYALAPITSSLSALVFGNAPVHHSWLVTKDGKIYDPTWNNNGRAYIGVPMTRDFVLKNTLRRGVYGLFGVGGGSSGVPEIADPEPGKDVPWIGEDPNELDLDYLEWAA